MSQNPVSQNPVSQNPVSPSAQSLRLEIEHGTIAVLDAAPADGAPVKATALLVPGYTGSKEDFAPILGRLAGRCVRVVALDLPGQYESAGPDDPGFYAVERLGEVVRSVARAIGAAEEPLHLLGHSFGGLVARAAAIAEPALFRSLVMLCAGPAGIPPGDRKERMTALEPVLHAGGMSAVYDAMQALERLDPSWVAEPPEVADFHRRRFAASSGAGLKGMGDALLYERDRVDELRATGTPVLVCYGENDDAWPPQLQADMAARLGAEREVIASAAHSPAAEQPEATAEVLARFWNC